MRAVVLASVLAVSLVVGSSAGVSGAVLPPRVEVIDPTPRILGPISVIGDSVLRGALVAHPNLVEQLAEQGWGPIRAFGVPGLSTGQSFRSFELTATYWFDRWRSEGWDPKAIVLIVGSNDVGFCAHFDGGCMSRSMRHLVDHIGPEYDIFLPHINHFFQLEWSDPWNRELDRLVGERPNVHTWAWDVELASGGYALDDVVHLTTNSYRRWSALTAAEVTADLGRSRYFGDNVDLAEPIAEPSRFSAVDPVRLVDTRDDPGTRLASAQTVLRVPVGDHVADGATSVAVYAAATRSDTRGFLQIAACGQPRPDTSVVNYTVGRAQGTATIVALDATRELCVYASGPVDVVIDLQGVFAPDQGSTFAPAPPARQLDTRLSGRAEVVAIDVDPAATGVALNVTAANAAQRGFLTAYPCGQPRPVTATLNFAAGQAGGGAAFVLTDNTHRICVYSSTSTDVILDQVGTFTDADDGLSFVAVTPTRILDTRVAVGGWGPFLSHHRRVSVAAVPDNASAVSGTIVMVQPFDRGFLAAYGCSTDTNTSSVNAPAGTAVANGFTVATSVTGRLCVSTSQQTQAVVDITGWWIE